MTSSSSTRKGSLFVLEQTKGNKPSWIPEGQQCQQNSRPKQQVYANFSNQSSSNNGSSNMMKPRRMSESRIIRNQLPPSSSSSAKAITRISSKGNTSTMRPMDMKSPRSVVISPPPAPEPPVSSSPFAEQEPKRFQRRSSSSLVVANSIEKPQRFQRSMQRKEQRSSARTSAADPRSRTNSTRSFSPSQSDDDDDVVDLDYSFDDGLNDGHLHEQEAEGGEEEEGMEMMMQHPGAYNVTPSSDLGPDTYFVSPRRSTSSSRSERDIMAQQQQQQSSVQSNTICDLDEEDDEDHQFEYDDFEHVQNDNDSYFSEENYGDEDRTAEAELVIAAELSQDLEREIEERVRKQVMAEAAQAAVVGVSVGAHQQQVPRRTSSQSQLQPVPATHMSNKVCLRTQLPWRIEQESATMKYIAIVQTNPQAKNLPLLEQQRGERRFVASSKREAREIAISMATPRPLLPNYVQSSHQKSCCSLCQTNFSFFKRKKYSCINCGMTMLCQGCVATWHKDSVPSTYYCCTDKSSSNASSNTVQVCTICDWSARKFQKALLSGDLEEARYLYKTHNINTRTPYNFLDNKSSKSNSKNKKEILYPIHAAILGGNLSLVKWLVINRCCPLVQTATMPNLCPSQDGDNTSSASPLRTSRGRSPVQLAMTHLPILHYLVHDLKFGLMDTDMEAGDTSKLVLGHLTQLLQRAPASMVDPNCNPKTKANPKQTAAVMVLRPNYKMQKKPSIKAAF